MSKATKADTPQKVNYNDAVAESKKYFDGDDLAATVWVSKYALKDSFGNIYEKSPREMHERIASEIERIEQKYPNPLPKEEVFALLDHFRYVIPQGGPMTGIGNNFQVASLSNCFVIGHKHPADSYGGIFRMDEEQVQMMKRRGGVGHDLSHIRPTGSPVLNSALTSTGIVPFMERYSNSTREVAQDGRRGALMLSLSIKHPDAERFIDAKVDTGKVTGANVSIKIDDEFMRAALAGKKYHQQFPIKSDNPKYEQDIDARKLWEKIIHNAWKSAEPGVLFWDTIIRESIPDCYADEGFVTVSTNPCGEIPLCPYDSCRLLAMNLLSYVDNPFKADAKFNFDKFRDHVYKAMHMMDDIIDLELEKVEQIIGKIAADPEDLDVRRVELELWKKIREMARKGRRTGLGITAEGDMLAALGLRYGTQEAIDFAVEVQKCLALAAYGASVKMAAERGAFPVYDAAKEVNNPMIARIREADPALYEEMTKVGRRNIAMLTIAPTGTTSLMSQTTSGIEPVFRPVYKRRRKINPSDVDTHVDYEDETGEKFQEYNVYHHNFVKWLEASGYDTSKLATISDAELKSGRRVALPQGDGQRHRLGGQGQDAGRDPEVGRPLDLGDGQPPEQRFGGAGGRRLPHGLGVRLQGCHGLPRRLPRRRAAGEELQEPEEVRGASRRGAEASEVDSCRHRAVQERFGGLDRLRGLAGRTPLRGLHRQDRGGCHVHSAEDQEGLHHQGARGGRHETL